MKEEDIKAASNFYASLFSDNVDSQVREDAFIYGATWMKNQMMKDSFDATVCKVGATFLKEMDKDCIVKALESYSNGDKVKVIIIKE